MKKMPLLIAALLFAFSLSAQEKSTLLLDSARLSKAKALYQKRDGDVVALVKPIVEESNKLLTLVPKSILEKSFTPPSGDKHDYMSMAPYFWPDPTKPDGKPYIRKDGERNPEINKITDKSNMGTIERACRYLSLAYYFTGDEKYAVKGTQLLQFWFIDKATRMNPNLNYAQAVPGVNDGRGIGIIETVSLTSLTDAIVLLEGSAALTPAIDQQLRNWFEDYRNWMLTSKNGNDEHNALNNHGTWYDMQMLTFSLFLGKKDFAKEYAQKSLLRIPVQIEKDGKQPLELERTTALGYSTFNIDAWFKVATLAQKAGVDIWNYKTTDGRGIKLALDWLWPYAVGEKKWEYKQIHEYKPDGIYFLLMTANAQYPDNGYEAAAIRIKKPSGDPITNLMSAM
ncbi:MAG: alginate lyase family protein [Filimonas sp.]|nr:alginate lyase family protein [Filimonas sp.]